jgi:thiamine biosynthesis protein ThiI
MDFIVKLFPEITIKSAPVRKRFIRQLRENLRTLLAEVGAPVKIIRAWDKIDVVVDSDDPMVCDRVANVLANTPGIANFSQVLTYPLGDLDDIFQKTLAVWGEALAGKTFCVRVKRSGEHDFTSIEVERYVGGGLNQHSEAAGVKLKNPDITVMLEVRKEQLHVIENQTPGLGGFPLGSQEPILSLISGGFDSTVASYLTIKRGIRTHYCFFNLGGRAHEVGVKEIAYYLWKKYGASHRVMFVAVPFEEVVGEILDKVHNPQMGVVLKRMMMRAASRVAEEMEIQALLTGEAIGQVSSQTLTNLAVIDGVTDTLTLRPLIAMDKGDIIDISRAIGAEELSASIPEYCGVISRKPTTRAKLDRIEAEETKFDFDILDRAIKERTIQGIESVMENLGGDVEVDVVAELGVNQQIIDVRHPDEEELKPLVSDSEILKIPFYKLTAEFSQLSADVQYLLYCDKGVMSQLHASNLKEDGHDNIGVYRPV